MENAVESTQYRLSSTVLTNLPYVSDTVSSCRFASLLNNVSKLTVTSPSDTISKPLWRKLYVFDSQSDISSTSVIPSGTYTDVGNNFKISSSPSVSQTIFFIFIFFPPKILPTA